MSHPLDRIRRGLVFLAVFVMAAVLLRNILTNDSTFLESIYWLVITISSVGYGEETNASPSVQAFTIGVILVGMSAAAYTFGGLIQLMAEGEVERIMGVRRMTRDIEKQSDHVIICGFGRVGRSLAAALARQGVNFVIVDREQERIAEAQAEGYLAMEGDTTEESVLRDAGVERAATLISALGSDANNVFLTLTAKNIRHDLRIIARGEHPQTEKKLLQAGATRVVLPTEMGAQKIATLITRPHAAELIERMTDHSTLDVDLGEFVIPAGNQLENKTVREAQTHRKHKLLIVGIRRTDGSMVFNPDADDQFHAGDTLIVMGQPEVVNGFRKEFDI